MTSKTTKAPPPTQRMRVAIVPDDMSLEQFQLHAEALWPDADLEPRFWTTARWRPASRLVGYSRPRSGSRALCAGGPLHLLDLASQRTAAASWAHARHTRWQSLTRDTPKAKPWTAYLQRHRSAPDKYSLPRAEEDFSSQPRILALRTYNASVTDRQLWLSTAHVEMFQAGAEAYAAYCADAALVHDRLVLPDGTWLAPASDTMSDRLSYHEKALGHLRTLPSAQRLVALTFPN